MLDGQVLVATIRKKSRIDPNDKSSYEIIKVGYDRQRIVHDIENTYGIRLAKDEADDLPWFTDGGFRYRAENQHWTFEIEARVHDLV